MAFSFVRDAFVQGDPTLLNSNTTAAFGSNIGAGHLLYAIVVWNSSSSTLLSCSNGHDVFTVATQKQDTLGGESVGLCFTCSSAGGFTTGITATLASSATANFFSVYAQEWSGGATSGCLDNAVTSALGSTGLSISTNITTATVNELIVAGVNWNTTHASVTVGSGFATNGTNGATALPVTGSEQQIATSATTYAAALSWLDSVNACQVVAAFQLPSGATIGVDEDFWFNPVPPVSTDSVITVF